MAVLTWVGSGYVEASFIDELLDIERTPRKPSYDLSAAVNLTLVDCAYEPDALHWRWDDDVLASTAQIIADQFVDYAVKAEVLRHMYSEVKGRIKDEVLRDSCSKTLAAASLGSRFFDMTLDYENSKTIEEKQKGFERRRVRKLIHRGSYQRAAELYDEINKLEKINSDSIKENAAS